MIRREFGTSRPKDQVHSLSANHSTCVSWALARFHGIKKHVVALCAPALLWEVTNRPWTPKKRIMKRVTLIPTSTVDHTPVRRRAWEWREAVRFRAARDQRIQCRLQSQSCKSYETEYVPALQSRTVTSHRTLWGSGSKLLAFEYDYTVLLARWLAMNGPGKLKVMAGEEITDCTIGTVRRWIQGGWGCLRRWWVNPSILLR